MRALRAVVKKVINAYGGTLTASDFPLLVDGAGVKSGVPVSSR